MAGCGSTSGDSAPASSITTTTNVTTADPLAAFGRATILIGGAEWEVAVADTEDLRSRGLMGVTSLGDLAGMLFVFTEDTEAGFWMKDTLIPLDVAFFAADGSLVDLIPMLPCSVDPCPTYDAAGPYRYALEAPPGSFDAIDQPTLVLTEG